MMLRTLALAATTLTALGALGCSDPVPPPSQGGVSITISPASPQPPETSCQRTTGHSALIGNPAPNQSARGTPVVDGEGGAEVSCRVSGAGRFSVSGKVKANAVTFNLRGGQMSAEKDGTGTGSVASFDVKGLTLGAPTSTPCTLTTIEVKAGAAWGRFECNAYIDSQSPTSAHCRATGVFLLENCEQ
jgi:hypothetical protein